jgi:hypothetical protein
MFIRLTPAQSTGVHGWGERLKTTLSWRDIEEREDIDLDLLARWDVSPKLLRTLQPDVRLWVLHAGARPAHANLMIPWPAHPLRDLHGDLADVIALGATSRHLKAMGVTYCDLCQAGMKPETMRLMNLTFQGWIDLGLGLDDAQGFTDAQLGRVFGMTRNAVCSCFRA